MVHRKGAGEREQVSLREETILFGEGERGEI